MITIITIATKSNIVRVASMVQAFWEIVAFTVNIAAMMTVRMECGSTKKWCSYFTFGIIIGAVIEIERTKIRIRFRHGAQTTLK